MKKALLISLITSIFFSSMAQNSRSTVFTNAREKLGDQKFIVISKTIYKGATTGINGKVITAYQDDKLTKIISPKEILLLGATEEVVQVPVDKKDPNSMIIDTVIRNNFNPENTKGYKLLQEIKTSAEILKYSAEMVAIAPTFDLVVSGVRINEQPLFWVKIADLKTILDDKTYTEFINACIP